MLGRQVAQVCLCLFPPGLYSTQAHSTVVVLLPSQTHQAYDSSAACQSDHSGLHTHIASCVPFGRKNEKNSMLILMYLHCSSGPARAGNAGKKIKNLAVVCLSLLLRREPAGDQAGP